jgi:hypothetical protein
MHTPPFHPDGRAFRSSGAHGAITISERGQEK